MKSLLLTISCMLITISSIAQEGNRNSSRLVPDTIVLNNLTLLQFNDEGHFITLMTLSGDTIVKEENFYHKAVYEDINKDGYKDIRVFIFSNMPNQCDTYFFDPKTKKFRYIEDAWLDFEQMKNTSLYVAYSKAGCASQNWEGSLSKIVNWKLVDIGTIRANNCNDESDGVYIYKVQDGDEQLIQKLSIAPWKDDPLDVISFMAEYWVKHYKKFMK